MKKITTLFLFVAIAATTLFAQTDTEADFSSVCTSGQVLYYKVVDYGEVNVWYNNDYPEVLGGFVVIPRSVKLSEAPSYGEPIVKFHPDGKGAKAYESLAEEVINRG